MENLEVSKDDLFLIYMLLKKEEVVTRIGVHHSRRAIEYQDYLKQREADIQGLLERVKKHLPEEKIKAA